MGSCDIRTIHTSPPASLAERLGRCVLRAGCDACMGATTRSMPRKPSGKSSSDSDKRAGSTKKQKKGSGSRRKDELFVHLDAAIKPAAPKPSPPPLTPPEVPLTLPPRNALPDPRGSKPLAIDLDGWVTIGRPGFAGKARNAQDVAMNQRFGPGRWRIVYAGQDRGVISRNDALLLYEDAYVVHFLANPDELDWLIALASEVYDTARSNIDSGFDYHQQETVSTHLQDIAVRCAVHRLGRRFEGDALVRIRGRRSKGARLSPGVVRFHRPSAILQPRVEGWWKPNSIEDYWQSSKLLQVLGSVLDRAETIDDSLPGAP